MFARASWQAAAEQLAAISRLCLVPPRRPALLAQLTLARQHQVRVPRTIITSDLSVARAAFSSPRLIIKAVDQHFVEAEPGRLTGIFPLLVERSELPSGPCYVPPVVVQEYVEHDAELRAYYVAGQIHAFSVTKSCPADPWIAPERVLARLVDPPPAVASAIRVLAPALGLRFGAFDFLVRDGDPVFLEVNPDGDWRWAELRHGTMAVTVAVASMIADLHRAARPTVPGAVPHTGSALNLLAFLSCTCGPVSLRRRDSGKQQGSSFPRTVLTVRSPTSTLVWQLPLEQVRHAPIRCETYEGVRP
jgi:hypothetical protein